MLNDVCLEVNPVGKPDAVAPHVRFDERGRETGLQCYRARPRLYWCSQNHRNFQTSGLFPNKTPFLIYSINHPNTYCTRRVQKLAPLPRCVTIKPERILIKIISEVEVGLTPP